MLVTIPPSLLESEYPSMTSCQPDQESISLRYPGLLQTLSIMAAAFRNELMDSNNGTGIIPGSSRDPSSLSPADCAHCSKAQMCSSCSTPLITNLCNAAPGNVFFQSMI